MAKTHPNPLPIANMLWVEGKLGPVERACIRSALAQGHQLVLWHYRPVEGLPDGVELRDGNEVVPCERLFRHVPTGSWSLFSNLFRYRLLQLGLGLWLDCDAYLVKPVEWGNGHVFGFDDGTHIASGVLGLPADCPVLAELIGFFGGKQIPPWLRKRWKLRFAVERALFGKFRIEAMPWGGLGPDGLTHKLREHGLTNHASTAAVYYPWAWREADIVFEPAELAEARIGPETRAFHLYNQLIRERKDSPAPPGSFLERLQREGA